jgi:ribonucleoside-triphosphate reductase
MLPTDYQEYIHRSRYARYLDDKGRRETWDETVDRYVDHVVRPHVGDDAVCNHLRNSIYHLEVMPSMRGLMTAGPALEQRGHLQLRLFAYGPSTGFR